MKTNPIILHIDKILECASDDQLRLIYMVARAIVPSCNTTEANSNEIK